MVTWTPDTFGLLSTVLHYTWCLAYYITTVPAQPLEMSMNQDEPIFMLTLGWLERLHPMDRIVDPIPWCELLEAHVPNHHVIYKGNFHVSFIEFLTVFTPIEKKEVRWIRLFFKRFEKMFILSYFHYLLHTYSKTQLEKKILTSKNCLEGF